MGHRFESLGQVKGVLHIRNNPVTCGDLLCSTFGGVQQIVQHTNFGTVGDYFLRGSPQYYQIFFTTRLGCEER